MSTLSIIHFFYVKIFNNSRTFYIYNNIAVILLLYMLFIMAHGTPVNIEKITVPEYPNEVKSKKVKKHF